jgi:hypothetical protein
MKKILEVVVAIVCVIPAPCYQWTLVRTTELPGKPSKFLRQPDSTPSTIKLQKNIWGTQQWHRRLQTLGPVII